MSRPPLTDKKSSDYYLSPDFTAAPINEGLLPSVSADPTGTDGVALAPWKHNSFALIGLGCALLLQGALLAVAIYITRHPVLRPTALPIFSTVSLKSFNVIVVVVGSVISGCSAYGISVGARSYLSHKLVTKGVSLANFEELFAVGNVGLVRKLSFGSLLPLVMFILASSASSALVGTFSAATEHQILDFSLYYVGYLQNYDFYSNNATLSQVVLNSPQDFEAFPFRAGRWVNGNISTNETRYFILIVGCTRRNAKIPVLLRRTAVDGTESTPSSGFLPVMLPVTAFTANVGYYQDVRKAPNKQFSQNTRHIIGNATDDSYTLAAPTAAANATCVQGDMTSTIISTSASYVTFEVQDSTCGSQPFIYRNISSNITGTYSCMAQDGKSAYIAYFNFLPSARQLFPVAQCTATAGYGEGTGITYADSDVSYKMAKADKNGQGAFKVINIVDASPLAINILKTHWYTFFGLQSSPGLTYFTQATQRFFVRDPLREFELLTIGTLTMALAKIMNTESYNSLYQPPYGNRTDGKPAVSTPYYTELSSTAIWIGPRGYNRAWLLVIASMFAALCVAFFLRPSSSRSRSSGRAKRLKSYT
ncbi:hypothetical protein P7C70_g1937, partial [Phenoliferia sp. Uapishka_3]